MARGLPLEGARADEKRALEYAGPDVVTCGLGDPVGPVRARVDASAYGFALVLAPDGTLMGRLRRSVLNSNPEARAEDVMQPGPATNRPNILPQKLLEKLRRSDLTTAILTDPDGRLMAVVRRSSLEMALESPQS